MGETEPATREEWISMFVRDMASAEQQSMRYHNKRGDPPTYSQEDIDDLVKDYERSVRFYLKKIEGAGSDLSELVVAARIVAYEDQSQEAIRSLDKALGPFAERIGWDDEPSDPANDADTMLSKEEWE